MEIVKIKGISDAREKEFNKLGVFDTSDLIKLFPRNYIDLREKQPLKYAYHNDFVLTSGKVVSMPNTVYLKRRFNNYVKTICEQEGLYFQVVWFNSPYVASKLKVGEEYLFYGRVQNRDGEIRMVNPTFESCDKNYRLKGIMPQYVSKGNLPQKLIRDSVRLAVNLEKPQSIIPQSILKKYGLSDLFDAYKEIHNPTNMNSVEKSADRIAVEEYFALISAFKYIKGDREQVRLNKYSCTPNELVSFINSKFPFEFTDGQKTAVNEIYTDMVGNVVMNRLIQGDVGSGKTAVSLCSIFIAVKSGYQAVMLAPTEVLARQNYEAIKKVFPEYNIDILTGSNTLKQKRLIKQNVSSGLTNVLIGTHAVLENDVEFKNLALCVCDEQQRFGVAQRSKLLSKGVTPDVLIMSATPIPRTLSLIFYGDLNITTILDKPKMRIPIQTNVVPKYKYQAMLEFISKEIAEGNQAYFVCPKIDGDEEGNVMNVTELYQETVEKLPNVKVGLLHGKMKDAEKNSIMQDFKDKKLDLLVSTTVIEVGVDVKDATVMVIFNAERFGLSQLHQLRGRVGRSDKKSYCFLLTDKTEGPSIDRLKVLKDNDDGFKISEKDYSLRGGGDFMGNRQSGKFMKDLGNLNYSVEAIFLAKRISEEVSLSGENASIIKKVALEKYEKLKDVTMN